MFASNLPIAGKTLQTCPPHCRTFVAATGQFAAMLDVMEKLLLLEELDMFQSLHGKARWELARRAKTRCYDPGAIIISPSAVNRRMYAVVSGEVQIRYGERRMMRIRRGEVFGPHSLHSWATAKAVAMGEVICLVVSPHDVRVATQRGRRGQLSDIDDDVAQSA